MTPSLNATPPSHRRLAHHPDGPDLPGQPEPEDLPPGKGQPIPPGDLEPPGPDKPDLPGLNRPLM